MEHKKTFGSYILQRRKELGMTQKEFAGQLFVTESAVSKWERGMSYPDITLLCNICSVLGISEHELLTGSEDTQKRNAENLAEKYLRLTRNFRLMQYIIYGAILLGCGIANLATGHTLDWFFIVLASVMMVASLTLAPALAALRPSLCRYKAAICAGCFTLSLELLLLICCIYGGGTWFPIAGISVLFGMTLVFLPFLLPVMPLPACMAHRKATVYLTTETFLLLLLLLICCIYDGGTWFFLTAASILFGLGLFILPVILRQAALPQALKNHKALLYFGIETILLFVLLLVADIDSGAAAFLSMSVPTALTCLVLPWGIMLAIRYLPLNGWFRAAVCSAWTGLWIWFAPFIYDQFMIMRYGSPEGYRRYPLWLRFDFTNWTDPQQVGLNVTSIVIFSFTAAAIFLAVVGFRAVKAKKTRD